MRFPSHRRGQQIPLVLVVYAACSDPPPPQVKSNDHFTCVDGETDVPAQEVNPGPFGDTGAIESTGAADETGGMAHDEFGPTFTRFSGDAGAHQAMPRPGFRSTTKCEPPPTRRDDIWDRARVSALTYCFGEFEDMALETAVREAIESVTWDYELAADVNFVHISDLDGTSCNDDADVVFIIGQGNDPDDCSFAGCPLARAFFPSDQTMSFGSFQTS